jgi:hypothetical protein
VPLTPQSRLTAHRGAGGARPSNHQKKISDAQLLAELARVASQLNRTDLSQTQFTEAGRYSFTTVCRRFGSWKAALQQVNLQPAHLLNATRAQLIADLQRIAAILGTTRLRYNTYIAHGNYSSKVIHRLFGNWQNAADAAGLTPVIRRPQSRQELFDNLKTVWQTLGRRPRYTDLLPPISKFGASVYTRRFGTVQKAVTAFVKFSATPISHDVPAESPNKCNGKCSSEDRSRGFIHRTPRTINLRLRFTVLKRDHFRCQSCGNSPANDPQIILQVDHKIAWTHGGETVLENLHTLCRDCNYGKSDLAWD